MITKGQATKTANEMIIGDMTDHSAYHLTKSTLGISVNNKNTTTGRQLHMMTGDVKTPDEMERYGGSMVLQIKDVNPHKKGDRGETRFL